MRFQGLVREGELIALLGSGEHHCDIATLRHRILHCASLECT